MPDITANDVGNFVKTELRKRIESDFCDTPYRIFREADLQSCCYFHLRDFLERDPHWTILNQPYLKALMKGGRGARPDLVLFKKKKPVILIELKFRRRLSGVRSKDQQVLRRAVKNAKWVKKAYYIELIINPTKESKRKLVPYRNRKITLSMRQDTLDDYLAMYRERRKPAPRR